MSRTRGTAVRLAVAGLVALANPDRLTLPITVTGVLYRGQLGGASTVDGPRARSVLTAPGPDIPILRVELSGCYRALLPPAGYLRQLDPAVASLLA
jgi:hypothetical protein